VLRDLRPVLGAPNTDELDDLVVLLQACRPCGLCTSLRCLRCKFTSFFHGPLTSSGFSTFCQRCKHCKCVRFLTFSAILFQFLPPFDMTACRSFSSCQAKQSSNTHARHEMRPEATFLFSRPAVPASREII
jgi:hypothetical protein